MEMRKSLGGQLGRIPAPRHEADDVRRAVPRSDFLRAKAIAGATLRSKGSRARPCVSDDPIRSKTRGVLQRHPGKRRVVDVLREALQVGGRRPEERLE